MDGFAAAFQSALPSFHPVDLLVGLCCGAALRLAVYIKGKNAKKYRKNMEYGSARWGTAEDIKPFMDPVFENNIILTQTERLTMNSRPKDSADLEVVEGPHLTLHGVRADCRLNRSQQVS